MRHSSQQVYELQIKAHGIGLPRTRFPFRYDCPAATGTMAVPLSAGETALQHGQVRDERCLTCGARKEALESEGALAH